MTPAPLIHWSDDLPLADLLHAYLAESRSPVTIGRLAQRAHVSRRAAEEALEQLATSGRVALVAGHDGVRLTTDAEDLEAYAKSLQRRMATVYLRVRAVRQMARKLRGIQQVELGL